jgi:hypothetical protein
LNIILDKPSIIRKSRNSVAVLNGKENEGTTSRFEDISLFWLGMPYRNFFVQKDTL